MYYIYYEKLHYFRKGRSPQRISTVFKKHILTDDEILHDPVISDYLSKFLNRVNGENKEDIQKRIHYEFNVLMYPCITESTTDIYQTTNPEIPIILELDVCFRKYLTDYSFM